MIKILQRYISKSIFQATGIASLIIISILFLMSLMGEAKSIGVGEYNFGQTILYVIMRLPNDLYHFSPLLILLGAIIGLSTLASNRELAVMRSSGFSIRKIIYTVLLASLTLILLITVIGEWAGPSLSYKAVMRKENAKHGSEVVATATGTWFHIENNFIYLQSIVGKQLINGVTRYEFDNNHKLQAVYYAKSLTFHNNQWMMNDVVKTSFYDDRTKSQSFKELPWDLKFNSNLLSVGLVDPNDMSLSKLAGFAHYLEKNGLQSNAYKYNFWQRIFQPFASIIMIFLAIPFVLGALSTSTMGWRIVIGILTGFAFFILDALLGQLCIVYQIPAIMAALFPPLFFGIVGVMLCRQLIRH